MQQEVDIRYMALHMLWLNHWWDEFGDFIHKLSPKMGHGIHDHFKYGPHETRLFGERRHICLFSTLLSRNGL